VLDAKQPDKWELDLGSGDLLTCGKLASARCHKRARGQPRGARKSVQFFASTIVRHSGPALEGQAVRARGSSPRQQLGLALLALPSHSWGARGGVPVLSLTASNYSFKPNLLRSSKSVA